MKALEEGEGLGYCLPMCDVSGNIIQGVLHKKGQNINVQLQINIFAVIFASIKVLSSSLFLQSCENSDVSFEDSFTKFRKSYKI